MSWISQNIAGGTFLSWQPLLFKGISHGFGAADFSYHSERAKKFEETLSAGLGVRRVFQAQQVHGKQVFDLRFTTETCEADIIIGQFSSDRSDAAMFIKTADCVPVLGVGSDDLVLIHAGWRGLANGAIEEGLSRVKGLSLVLIGPSAGSCCYEVGKEVLNELGDNAVYTVRNGKYYLSTGQTAFFLASKFINPNLIKKVDICTICDSRYNSYRRSGNEERNISFARIFLSPSLS